MTKNSNDIDSRRNRIPFPTSLEIRKLRHKILNFYKSNRRDLPWRRTTDPYKIMVSEFMLQQTQVPRVIGYYERFIAKFPNLTTLANASQKELLHSWSGLGYNSRALRLKRATQILLKEFGGEFPVEEKLLRKLPGVGEYTSRAILAFAFNQEVPVIDINIRRVLLSELGLENNLPAAILHTIAKQLIPKGKSALWHNALMDYGAFLPKIVKELYPPLTKQSKFKGSGREARGAIIKKLLAEKSVTYLELLNSIKRKDRIKIISTLAEEGFIVIKNGMVKIR